MGPVLAIAAKDLRLLSRNRGHLFFTFAWPLIAALFFGTVFGGGGGKKGSIPVRVVDEDHSEASARLLAAVGRLDGVTATTSNRAEALDAVKHGQATAMVVAPAGFGEAAGRLFYGEPAVLELLVDPSRKAEAAMLEGQLMGAAMERMSDLFQGGPQGVAMVDRALKDAAGAHVPDPTLTRFLGEVKGFMGTRSPASAAPAEPGAPAPQSAAQAPTVDGPGWKPVAIRRSDVADERVRPRSGFEVAFPQGILWGMLGCALGFALSLVTERTRGTLARLQTTPLSRAQVLAGKALACFVALLGVQALLMTVGALGFGVMPGSFAKLAAACVSLSLCFVGLMMVVAVVSRREESASGTAWAVFLPLSMLGGGMVPLFALPAWMQTAGHVSPVKWGILALEGSLWRGFDWVDLALPCGVLLGVGVLAFGLGVRLFARAD